MRNIFLRTILGMISIGISQLICYFLIDDVFVNFATAKQSFLCLRLLIAVLIYISINWVMNWPIYNSEKDILFFSYVLLSISISLFRFKLGFSMPGNFNVIKIISYSKMTIFLNILFYIPFGYYFASRLKFNIFCKYIIFLFYALIIEASQHYLNVGFFDINNIILNYLGFLIGYTAQKVVRFGYIKIK